MEVRLTRRRKALVRQSILAAGAVVVVGGFTFGVSHILNARGARSAALAVSTPATQPTAAVPATQPAAVAKADKKHKSDAADKPVFLDLPATRPSLAIATKPAPTTPVDATGLFGSVDSKIKSEDLVKARDELIAALDAKKFSETEREAAYERLSKINETVVFGPKKFISDAHQSSYTVVAGDNLQKIANKFDVTVGFLQRVNNISKPEKLRLGANLKIVKGPFHAIVNKKEFTLDLYQGDPASSGAIFLKRLRVGLGEHDSTPTGTWKIGTKLTNPTYYNSRDEGPRVIQANDPANPLGERWLELVGVSGQAVGKESYGIHGTIDPASIGKKMSMGCVRLLNEDVNLVYDMLIKEKSTVLVTD